MRLYKNLCALAAAVGGAVLLVPSHRALATDPIHFFIPLSDDGGGESNYRPRFVFDNTRNQLVISYPHGGIDRYSMTSRSFLPHWNVGTSIYGVDITPDGSRILAGEGTTSLISGNNYLARVHSINPNTGAVTDFTYTTTDSAGSYDIAAANNGKVLITPILQNTPDYGVNFLRKLDLGTGAVTTVTGLRPNGSDVGGGSRIARGQDRSTLMAYDFLPSSYVYHAATDSFGAAIGQYIGGGVSPDGTRIASNFYDYGGHTLNSYLVDTSFNQLLVLPSQIPAGSQSWTFDPVRPIVYFTDHTTDDFVAASTDDGSVLWSYHPGYSLYGVNMMAVTADGQWSFTQVPNGILAIQIPAPGSLELLSVIGFGFTRRRRRNATPRQGS